MQQDMLTVPSLRKTEWNQCRVCMKFLSLRKLRSVYAMHMYNGQFMRISDAIMTCMPDIQISENDSLPQKICADCFRHSEITYNFSTNCRKASKTLGTAQVGDATQSIQQDCREHSPKQLSMCPRVVRLPIEFLKDDSGKITFVCKACCLEFKSHRVFERHLDQHKSDLIVRFREGPCRSANNQTAAGGDVLARVRVEKIQQLSDSKF